MRSHLEHDEVFHLDLSRLQGKWNHFLRCLPSGCPLKVGGYLLFTELKDTWDKILLYNRETEGVSVEEYGLESPKS